MKELFPLFDHALNSPSTFTPEALVEAVRMEKHLPMEPIPQICILEFDGDLTDWLVSMEAVRPCNSWACFHTTMFLLDVEGITCAIVPRTIGGPFAVLIAEQMAISGSRLVVGLTSAGRVSSVIPVPGLVSVTSAIRDEGTSYHYLPPSPNVDAPSEVATILKSELDKQPLPVRSGMVWSTDAPYRETATQLAHHAKAGVLAVEMQAASLFAFSNARRFPVGVVAHVTNSADRIGKAFDKGNHELEFGILEAICRAGKRFVSSSDC
jgi:uridine phosphorylase